MYDLCIVGAGMIGSAAARHATCTYGLNTCLVGPSEPKKGSSKCEIYGSYYDKGRITRCLDKDIVWSNLAQESIKRYRDLEEQSGINFYYEVGNLMIGGEKYLKKTDEVATRNGIQTKKLDSKSLSEQFPYLTLREDTIGSAEINKAGYINPRRIVEAQKAMAAKQRCKLIDDVVNHVTRIVQSDGSYAMQVKTEGGEVILSKKVLLATGAFTTFRNLLPGVKPDQILSPLIVSLIEVEKTNLSIFRDMPCAIYYGRANDVWEVPPSHRNKDEISFYLMPPIKYPDGRFYLKLGLQEAVSVRMTSLADIKHWFEKGDPAIAQHVSKFTASLFKGVKFSSWKSDSSVITETPTARPYIDMVHAQLGVAIGGNGYAAKSSDEIGRLAVTMVTDKWDSELPRQVFKLKLLPYSAEATFTSHKGKL